MLKKLLSLLIAFVIGGQTTPAPTAPPDHKQLQSFYFRFSGMMLEPIMGIDAEQTPEGWTATFLLGLMDEAEGVRLTEQDINALNALMDDYQLWSWADFNESDPSILDGEDFSFSASDSDGTRIHAHGSNAFPSGYRDAKAAILSAVEEMLIAHGIAYAFE